MPERRLENNAGPTIYRPPGFLLGLLQHSVIDRNQDRVGKEDVSKLSEPGAEFHPETRHAVEGRGAGTVVQPLPQLPRAVEACHV